LVVVPVYPFNELNTVQIKSDWVKTYGDGITAKVRQTRDGGFIIAGVIDDGSYLIKTDSQGELLWRKIWGLQYGFNDVKETREGGYIVCGLFGDQGLLLKTDSSGDISWENHYRVFGMGLYFVLNSVQQTSEGGFVAGGWRAKPPQEIEEGFIVKTDAEGNDEWVYTESESISSIFETSDGGYISTGVFDVWPPETDHIYYVGLCKRDSSGIIEWDVQISQDGSASSVVQLEDGTYVVACNGFASLAKTDEEGSIEMVKTYTNSSFYALDQASDGGFILVGKSGSCGYILRTDEKGEKQWESTFKDSEFQTVQSITGGYIIAGISNGQIALIKLSNPGPQ
jgi:hypothetical protein